MRALVVDDSKAIRSVLSNYLGDLGFEDVSEAADGREALERMKDPSGFDLVLVDWNMPEMDGLEFVETIRRDLEHRALPLMMVTTETEVERVDDALTAGADEYLMKPFTRDILRDKLRLLGIEV